MQDYASTSASPVWYKSYNSNPYILEAIVSVLRAMRALHHGGTLILVPNNDQWRHSTQKDIPYSGTDHLTGIHEAFYELEQVEHERIPTIEDEKEKEKVSSVMASWWRRRLEEASADLAQLTAVDGATVVTENLIILGFGVKLKSAGGEEALQIYVTDLLNPSEKNQPSSLDDLGGTRHQSAALFISEQQDATALVVSQDGGVSAFTWRKSCEGSDVQEDGLYVYRHLELTL